jgi:hypothetical protein
MRPDFDPALMTPDERRRELAAILATGLRRLRDRDALTPSPVSQIPSDTAEKPLEAVPENPLSVQDG